MWFPYINWVRHWLPPCNQEQMPWQLPLAQGLRAHRPWLLQAVLHIILTLLLPSFPCQTFPISVHPPYDVHLLGSLLIPSMQSGITSPTVHLRIDLIRRPVQNLPKPKPAVHTAHHRVVKNFPKCNWKHTTIAQAPYSTDEHNSGNITAHGDDKSTQDKSRENAAESDLESALEDCLTCSDMEPPIRMPQRRFQKRVWASCSLTRGCLWLETQVRWIKDSHQAIWDSNQEIVRAEWLITHEGHYTSFKVNRITTWTKQLLWIRKATHSKIYTQESKAKVQGQKKTLVQSLKQFHAHFYQFY